jgi:hypothetical protein
MFRTISKFVFIALTFCSALAHAQSPAQAPISTNAETQRMFIGVSTGLFDGLTTSYSTGIHAGWLGPPARIRQVGTLAPEVSVSVDYVRKIHLERLRHITDMIVRESYVGTVTAGGRVGGSLGFRALVGISGGGGRAVSRCSGGADWILLASVDNGKSVTNPAPAADGVIDPLCGKTDRRFPFAAEIGPDLRIGRVRLMLPVVVTSYGDAGSRRQYSYKFGIDFEFGGFFGPRN